MRGDHDELQLVAVELAQHLVGLLQVLDHPSVVFADAVERDADDVHRHTRTAPQNGLEVFLLHFEHCALAGGAHGGSPGCVLDQRHLSDDLPSAAHAQDPFLFAFDGFLRDEDRSVCDDIQHILIRAFAAQDMIRWIGAELGQRRHLGQLVFVHALEGQPQQEDFLQGVGVGHHEVSIKGRVGKNYNKRITNTTPTDPKTM